MHFIQVHFVKDYSTPIFSNFQYIICSLKSLEWKVTFVASVGNYFLGVCLPFGMCLFHPPCMQMRMHLAEKLILQRKMHGIMQNKESLASASLWVHLWAQKLQRKNEVPLKLKKKQPLWGYLLILKYPEASRCIILGILEVLGKWW